MHSKAGLWAAISSKQNKKSRHKPLYNIREQLGNKTQQISLDNTTKKWADTR